jgi:hypothetical protein
MFPCEKSHITIMKKKISLTFVSLVFQKKKKTNNYRRPKGDIIEWEGPLTDRGVKTFTDANPKPPKAKSNGQVIPYPDANSSIEPKKLKQLNDQNRQRQEESHNRQRKQEEYEALLKERKLIERQLSELDEIVSFKKKQEAIRTKVLIFSLMDCLYILCCKCSLFPVPILTHTHTTHLASMHNIISQ